jgi:hypothetical protein
MFDLEQSIAEWRKQMLAAGIKSPVPLEELEAHLREEIEGQIQSGVSEQQAFEIAVQRIGHAELLKKEFKKTKVEKYDYKWYLRSGAIWLLATAILNLIVVHVFHLHLRPYIFRSAYFGGIYATIIGLIKCAYKAKHPKSRT